MLLTLYRFLPRSVEKSGQHLGRQTLKESKVFFKPSSTIAIPRLSKNDSVLQIILLMLSYLLNLIIEFDWISDIHIWIRHDLWGVRKCSKESIVEAWEYVIPHKFQESFYSLFLSCPTANTSSVNWSSNELIPLELRIPNTILQCYLVFLAKYRKCGSTFWTRSVSFLKFHFSS